MSVVREEIIEYTRNNRRHFHSYPEKAWMEYYTAAFILFPGVHSKRHQRIQEHPEPERQIPGV